MPPAPVVYSDEDDCAAVARSGPSLFAGPASSRLQVHRTAGHRDTEGFHVDVESFQGYRLSWRKLPLVLLVLLCTAGTVLLFRRSSRLQLLLCLSKCKLASASHVLVTLTSRRDTIARVKTFVATIPVILTGPKFQRLGSKPASVRDVRVIDAFYMRFLYCPDLNTFVPVPGVPHEFSAQLVEVAAWLQQRTDTAAQLRQPPADLVSTFPCSAWDRKERRQVYGRNQRSIQLPSMLEQIVFQTFSPCCLFLYACLFFQIHFYQYYWWALVIGAVTLGSVGGSVVQTYSNKRGLNTLVRHVCNVDVVQPGRTHSVKSTELVPGDIVVVKQGRLPCDMVLLWGRAIVDENALTGESVPIRKSPFLSQHAGPGYRAHVHAPCTLQSGTQVLQAWTANNRDPVIAMVSHTRFATAEGQLLAAVATPAINTDPQYVKDMVIFLAVTHWAGVISWVPTAVMAHKFGLAARDVGISFGNMVIIALPPALVTCLAIVTACSIFRLYRRRISVSNAARIKAAGHVSVVCFDKTGTITEAGMHLKGILPVVDDRIAGLQVHHYNWSPAVRMLLATCHSLISVDDKLMGEDLDKQPFLSMGAAFVGPDLITLPSLPEGGVQRASKGADEQVSEEALEDDGQWLSILRQFEFSSTRQRIVLVTKALDSEEYIVNAKGSPEAILPLVDRQSIPLNFHKVLDDYASQGFRMMAMATGRLPRDTTPEEVVGKGQQEIEEAANLMFLGLCVIINKLHPESKGALKRLHNRAQMRTVMVTGDHVNTSISVAKMCGMLYERRPICVVDAVDISPASSALDLAFTAVYAQPQGSAALSAAEAMRGIAAGEYQCAVTGRGFVEMLKLGDPELTAVVLQNVVVAARMLPNHKQDLVALLGDGVDAGHYGCERIQGLGNYVAFCGDGLNDMVALKAASVGVSLCAGGANSPAAPFTAHQRNVGSMAAVLAEGRCTLVITYFMFQYMAVYSVNQAVLTNILAFYGLAPSNNQYLLMDILFVFVFTTLVARTEPTLGLTREKPPPRLLSPVIVLPCLVQAVMATAMQLGAIGLLQLQAWYRSTDVLANPALQGGCAAVEAMVVYLVSLAQLTYAVYILASHLRHHTQPLATNKLLVVWLMACAAFVCYLLFEARPSRVSQRYCMVGLPTRFRWQLFAYIIANAALAVLADGLLQHVMSRLQWQGSHQSASGIWRLGRMTSRLSSHMRMSSQASGTQRSRQSMQSGRIRQSMESGRSMQCVLTHKALGQRQCAAERHITTAQWQSAPLLKSCAVEQGAQDIKIPVADVAASTDSGRCDVHLLMPSHSCSQDSTAGAQHRTVLNEPHDPLKQQLQRIACSVPDQVQAALQPGIPAGRAGQDGVEVVPSAAPGTLNDAAGWLCHMNAAPAPALACRDSIRSHRVSCSSEDYGVP